MVIADRYQLLPERRAERAAFYQIPLEVLDPERPNRMLTDELTKRGFPFVDPTPALRERAKAASLYYVQDNHFTPAGHAVFARNIADRLAALVAGPALSSNVPPAPPHGKDAPAPPAR